MGGSFVLSDDEKVNVEKKSVARPLLLVEMALPLVPKSRQLDLNGANPAAPPDVTDGMKRAVDQIRVDWSFRDMEPDYAECDKKTTGNETKVLTKVKVKPKLPGWAGTDFTTDLGETHMQRLTSGSGEIQEISTAESWKFGSIRVS